MSAPGFPPVTEMLLAWGRGDEAARDELMAAVYADLRRRAAIQLRREREGHTLDPAALVHETYLRLAEHASLEWKNRSQFFGVASEIMRRILVDHARRRRAAKRGGGLAVTLTGDPPQAAPGIDVLALDDALRDLAALEPRQSRIVELRYFGGLSVEETAALLDLSSATVKREWTSARAWLFAQIRR